MLLLLELQGSYLEGIGKQIGGLTQKVKSWYWGRPLVSCSSCFPFDFFDALTYALGSSWSSIYDSEIYLSSLWNCETNIVEQTEQEWKCIKAWLTICDHG